MLRSNKHGRNTITCNTAKYGRKRPYFPRIRSHTTVYGVPNGRAGWEQQSFDMIRQIAQDTRKKLEDTIGEHTTKLTNAATKISDELYKAREDNDYFETDLERWMKKLDGLQNDLNQPPSINIDNDNAMSLIIKTLLNNHIV